MRSNVGKIWLKRNTPKIENALKHSAPFYEAVGSLPVMSSLLPHVLQGRSQVSLFFASVVSPGLKTKEMPKNSIL